jgi:glycosyltransferase involved in cell wall biosynthesis
MAALCAKADLLFSPTPHVVPWGLVPVVATVADVTPLRLPPELLGANSVMRAFSYVSARFSRKIITLSQCSKRDIVELYVVPPEKVSVIHCGYDDKFYNTDPPDEQVLQSLLDRFGIRRPYIFHHGTIQPRKNFQRLIEAYGLALESKRNLDAQLVLAGSFGWQHEPIIRAGNDLKGPGKVIFTGSLPEDQLALLLKGSIGSVIPSLYEGFCLPMVEAMACGVPTITANSSCLPEISDGVLRYFDPRSIEDMTVRICELLEDESLRNELSTAGAKRASDFSWARCARETYDLLINAHENDSLSALCPKGPKE